MNLRGIVRWNPLDIAIITEDTVLLCQSTRRTVLFDLLRLNNNLFAHQFNIPFFIWMVAKVLFAISTQIPLAERNGRSGEVVEEGQREECGVLGMQRLLVAQGHEHLLCRGGKHCQEKSYEK